MRLLLALFAHLVAAPPATPTAAPASQETDGCPGGWVFFEAGAARLDDPARQVLDELADRMRQMVAAGAWLNVIASTDDSGGAARNLALSQRRAREVRNYLVRRGLPASSLRVIARGEARPGWCDPRATPAVRRRLSRNVQVQPEMPRAVFERFFPPGAPVC